MPSSERAFIYCRLSREDAATEGKFERQLATAHELAAYHGLHVPSENVVIEQVSGARLKNRSGLLRLMELMSAGLCTHLITSFDDRLDRLQDKHDAADFEECLFAGGVTVISRDGVRKYDEDFEFLPSEVRALVARHELRVYARRRREANRQRHAQNVRWSGAAPYGYRKNKEAAGGYDIIPSEYSLVEEVFGYVLAGRGLDSIAQELNARGLRTRSGAQWWRRTLSAMIVNPVYCGYHARRCRKVRGKGWRYMPPADYVLAGGEVGQWEKPITLAEWETLRARFQAYREKNNPRTALLTGILHCPACRPMRAASDRAYGCECPSRHYASRKRWDDVARDTFCRFLREVDRSGLATTETPKPKPHSQLSAAKREMQKREEDVRSLAADSERQRRLLGDALYETVMLKARNEYEAAQSLVQRLQEQVDTPDRAEGNSLLLWFYGSQPEELWDAATVEQRRAWLRTVLRRISLEDAKPGKVHKKRAHIELQEWAEEALEGGPVPSTWWQSVKGA